MRLRPRGFFLVRSALLPVEFLDGGVGAALERATHDRQVQEALWWSAPSLLTPPEPGSHRAAEARTSSLARYLQRFASRATPTGLAASVALGRIEPAPSSLEVGAARKLVTASMVSAWALASSVAAERDGNWGPAPSLAIVSGLGRYEVHQAAGDRVDEVRRTVEVTAHVAAVLAAAAPGARRRALAEALVAFDPELDLEAATDFIGQLIAEGVLVPFEVPRLTEPDPLQGLSGWSDQPDVARLVDAVREVGATTEPAHLEAIARRVPGGATAFEPALVRPSTSILSSRTADELAATFGRCLEAMAPQQDPRLSAFAQAFVERFEDAEIPLLLALDPVLGLEPARAPLPPLLAGVPWGEGVVAERESHTPHWLLEPILSALRAGAEEVVLDDSTLPRSGASATTATALFQVECPPDAGPDDARARFVLKSGAGTCNLRTLGRFSVSLPELTARLRELASEEERLEPGVIFAEVLYQPPDPGLSLCRRAPVRRAAIPVNTRADPESFERVLHPSELLVSVSGGRVLLRWATTGHEVRPRIASAYRADNPQVSRLYALLEAIAHQDTVPFELPLGALAAAPVLPRIRLGRVVLQPARWLVSERFRARLRATPQERRPAVIRDEARAAGWPRLSRVHEEGSDQSLRVDLDDALSVSAASKVLSSSRRVTMLELCTPGLAPGARGPGGHHVVELQLPFVEERAPSVPVRPRPALAPVRLRFPPRSEWRTIKAYGAPQTLERVLQLEVVPHVGEAPWFFLFYADPRAHLRLRFSADAMRVDELLERLEARVGEGLLWKVEETTYVREVERYGGPEGITLAERVFWADSVAVSSVLPSVPEQDRWLALLQSTDELWRTLGVDEPGRLALARRQARAYGVEFREGASMRDAASRIARTHRSQVDRALAGPHEPPMKTALERRAEALVALQPEFERARLRCPREEVYLSLAHLSATRWVSAHVRETEWLVSHLLERALHSRLARR